MEEWKKVKARWRNITGRPPPADNAGWVIEPLKSRIIDLWNNRPRFSPIWAYRYWWLKSWTVLIGSGIAIWQGAVMISRPRDPVRLDDVMTVTPTLHAVRNFMLCAQ